MDISLMRSRIKIQKNTVVTDAIGNHKNTWTDWHTCYAYANMAQTVTGGKERESSGQIIASDAFTFTVRYCSRLANLTSDGYRIIFNDHIYNITKVDDFQFRHKTLKLTAERVQR